MSRRGRKFDIYPPSYRNITEILDNPSYKISLIPEILLNLQHRCGAGRSGLAGKKFITIQRQAEMRRRRMGISRLKKKQEEQKRFAAAAKELEASDLAHVTKLMAKFKVCQGRDSKCRCVSFSLNKTLTLNKTYLYSKTLKSLL